LSVNIVLSSFELKIELHFNYKAVFIFDKFELEKIYPIENKKFKIPVLALVPCFIFKNSQVWQEPLRGPE